MEPEILGDRGLQKKEIDNWADMWDQAQAKGVFDDVEQPHTPSPQTSDGSFFGLQSTHSTEAPSDVDAQYWNNISKMSGNGANVPDPTALGEEEGEQLLRDATDISQSWTDSKSRNKKYPPNPMRVDSGGEDQKLKPIQLGHTFDEEDIQQLADMRLKLHDLGSKLAADPQDGNKKVESQIEGLKKKLEELSSSMGYALPNEISAQVRPKKNMSIEPLTEKK